MNDKISKALMKRYGEGLFGYIPHTDGIVEGLFSL